MTSRSYAAVPAADGASEQDITDAITAHDAATDPHGDRAAATTAISTHSAATDPHGDRSYADTQVATKPALTSTAATISAVGDTASAGSATTAAKADHQHGREAFGTPGSSAVGDSANAGTATTSARSDHRHGREAFGPVTAQTSYGSASGNGAATTSARSDHTHGTPSLASSAASSSAVGDAASAGSGSTAAKADHVHGREGFSATLPLVASGTGSAGAATTPARSDHAHPVNALAPSDHGLIAWNFPPYAATSTALAPVSGTIYVVKIPIPVATTITNVIFGINAAGSGLTSNQNFAALFSSAKALLSATADQTTSWGSITGPAVMALSAQQSVAAGYVYAVILSNGTTPPTLNRGAGNINNVGLTAATATFATAGTAQTSIPSTITTTAYTAASIWAAVS